MDRRRLLGLICTAPAALPVIAKAAVEPTILRGATLLSAGFGVQRLEGACSFQAFRSAELARLAAASSSRDLSVLTYADVYGTHGSEAVRAQAAHERARWGALGLAASSIPACAPFLDDVGSGP